MGTTEQRSSWDEVFDALRVEQRRNLMRTLLRVAPTREEMDYEFIIEMHHCHLPKLDSQGFFDWNPDTQTVTEGDHLEKVSVVLEAIHDYEVEVT